MASVVDPLVRAPFLVAGIGLAAAGGALGAGAALVRGVAGRAEALAQALGRVEGAAEHAVEDAVEGVTGTVGSVVDAVEGAVEGVVEAVGGVVAEVVDDVETVVEEGVDLVEDSLGRHRRVWEDDVDDAAHQHVQIEGRALDEPGARGLRRRIQAALEEVAGVQWAEVNALTGRIAVAFDERTTPLSAIVAAIEAAEEAHGVRRRRLDDRRAAAWDPADRADHPADIEPIHRTIAAITGGVLGLGLSLIGSTTRLPRVPIELAGLVSLLDNQPWLRRRVEDLLGKRLADLVLPLSAAAANGVAQGPVGISVDLALQGLVLSELHTRRDVWARREREFYANPSHDPIEPPDVGARPVPLPPGPVEIWSERISLGGLAGFGAALLLSRDLRRAADAFLAAVPKAARVGREAFATQFGRVLAARGVVPLDASALRRLDRIDTVVLDSDDLVTRQWQVASVLALGDHPLERLEALARDLFDPLDPGASRTGEGWVLEPFGDGARLHPLPRGAVSRAREVRRAGATVLALHRGGRLHGLVAAEPVLDPGAELVVDAVRAAGHRLVVAGSEGAAGRRLGADETIPRGKQLGAAVRALQAQGAGVMVIARRGKRGLAAADVGVGVTRATGRPPWGADLVCGRQLAEAALIVAATAEARQVSVRSAALAGLGSAAGAVLALTGTRRTAGRRALTLVNGAAAVALVTGAASGAALAQRPRIVSSDDTPWHELELAEVLERLQAGTDGLTEDGARARRAPRSPTTPPALLDHALTELANPLNPVLAVGAGISAAMGATLDAALVGALIALNTGVGAVQRLAADRAVTELFEAAAIEAVVRRDGSTRRVPEHELVPGDVVELDAGDPVPADCRVLEAEALEADESNLTGESMPVPKHLDPTPGAEVAERACMLFDGTTIATGRATALVVATGADTEAGRGLAMASVAPPPSGVEQRLAELSKRIVPGVGLAGVAALVAGVLRGWPLRDVLSTGVSLAMAAVPEGLPFVASASELAAARRLAGRNAVVRNPRTIEALGRVDVLCFDKTGTLTEGGLALRRVTDGVTRERPEHATGERRDVLAAALRATPLPDEDPLTHATDRAVVAGGERAGLTPEAGVPGWRPTAELPFEANRALHAVLGRDAGGNRLSVKGAPEVVLPLCVSWRRGATVVELDDAVRAQLDEVVEGLAGRGYRVLAVAERPAPAHEELEDEHVERLELLGFVGLADPVRPAAAEAVAAVRAAGVRPVMITGDHPITAAAIADELDLAETDGTLTGQELDALDDAALDAVIESVAVFARVTPAQKLRIVEALQRRGRVVAMTGDGANDAPAIRLADVGVALGRAGPSAARDAADVVVSDDRVETIVDAIVEGRALWSSVRDALAILVGGNLGEVGFTVAASMLSPRAPLNPRQFLLVNLLTDLAPALAVATRPPRDRRPEVLLREGPEKSLGSALSRDIAVRAVATAASATAAWGAARLTGTTARAGTVGVVALVSAQLGQTVAAGHGRSPLVLATGLGSFALLAAIVQTPGVSPFFGCRPLGPVGWGQALAAGATATAGAAVVNRWLASRELAGA